MRKFIVVIIFIVAITFNFQQVEGRVLEIGLKKMVLSAGKIVACQCTEIQKGFHPEYTNVKVTFIELNVLDVLKGNVGKRLKFMQFGHGIEMVHASKYKKGERMLLFLYPNSQYGFTSPVGGNQGKLFITTDQVSGKPDFVKVLNKRKFFKGIDTGIYTKESEAITDNIDLTGNDSKLIKYETFRQAILAIINNDKNGEENKE